MKKLFVLAVVVGIAGGLATAQAGGLRNLRDINIRKAPEGPDISKFLSGGGAPRGLPDIIGGLKEILSGGKTLRLPDFCREDLPPIKCITLPKLGEIKHPFLPRLGGDHNGTPRFGGGGCPSVPEPSSALASLAVLGFGGLLVRRHRKR